MTAPRQSLVFASSFVFLIANGCHEMPSSLSPTKYFSGCQLQIFEAAQLGSASRVGDLSQKCQIALDASGQEDMTLLALASIRSDREAIIALVHAGADPFHVIKGAGSPVVMAINRHFQPPRIEAIAAFHQAGLDFNARLGDKPYLFYFVDYAHWQGLHYALANGGNVNITSGEGETLLSYVVGGNHLSVARSLLSLGADPAHSSKYGDRPLETIEFAISRGDQTTPEWRDQVNFRDEILDRIADPEARITPFTAEAVAKIKAAAI